MLLLLAAELLRTARAIVSGEVVAPVNCCCCLVGVEC